jgi:hypothetical protein
MGRDRVAIARLKRQHWAEVRQREGSDATIRIGHALYEHARRVQPGFPQQHARDADLRDHIALKQKLDRAAHAFSVR